MIALLARLVDEVLEMLQPIIAAATDPDARAMVLAALNADDPRLTEGGVLGSFSDIGSGISALREISGSARPSIEQIGTAMEGLRALVEGIRMLGATQGSDYPGLGADLINLAVVEHIRQRSPLAFQLAVMFGIIERRLLPEIRRGTAVIRPARAIDRLMVERLNELFDDPVALLKRDLPADPLGTTAEANRTMDLLVGRCGGVLTALDISWSYGLQPGDAEQLGAIATDVAHALCLFAPASLVPDTEAALVVRLSSKDQDDLGVILSPFGSLDLTTQVGSWRVETMLGAHIQALAFGGGAGFRSMASSAAGGAQLKFIASRATQEGVPAAFVGEADGTRLELGAPAFAARLEMGPEGTEVVFSAGTGPSALVVAPGGADGFLRSLLPAGGMRTDFDLGLEWSRSGGFAFKGTGGLDLRIPVGLSLEGVTLSDAHLRLRAENGQIYAEASVSLSAKIGPVSAAVDSVGMSAMLEFSDEGGSLGVADFDLRFKPPDGIGLVVDAAGIVAGGGFLFHKPAARLYAGAMQLSLAEGVTLKAFGLITSESGLGGPDYSLLVFITAEGFQPIPLGMGFTLTGIGGMLALHRTYDEDAIRQQLQSGTLGSLFFPGDIVANAGAVVQSLNAAFPARKGAYLVGILARIAWFTPTLIQFDLALIFEFGARHRLLVIGRISSLLPSAENDLVRINLDAIGKLDFDEGTATIDAVLVDSRLAHKYALTGGMALRARWTEGPGSTFVLAIGGLNPRFPPPPGLPRLERMTIALSSGDNPRIRCKAYLAVTANTLQFGAQADLYAAAYGFSIQGDIGFDVLIQYRPLHFIADFRASVQLKRVGEDGSHNLFKVSVKGALEGPRPLRVSGKASFEICWCDFSVSFDKTLVEGEKPPAPPSVDALAELKRAVFDPRNWVPGADARHGVSLRELAPGEIMAVDPIGLLSIGQQIVPLNTREEVQLYGGAPVTGARRFKIGAEIAGAEQNVEPLFEQFAPSQYFELSDDAKLTGESFDRMEAGIAVRGPAPRFASGEVLDSSLTYDEIVIDDPARPAPVEAGGNFILTADALLLFSRTGAAARAPIRSRGAARYRVADAVPAVSLAAPKYTIVSLDERAPPTAEAARTDWTEGQTTLARLNRDAARWQLIPTWELVT